MTDFIKVSARQIDQDREKIAGELEGIRSSVEALFQEMQQLAQTWEGPAWQTFQRQVAADIENMRQIHQNLAEYLEHIDYAANAYRRCEDKVERLVNSIRI